MSGNVNNQEIQEQAPRRTWHFDSAATEEIVNAISAVTIDPIRSLVTFLFPTLGAFFSGYRSLRPDDPTQDALLGSRDYRKRVVTEIDQLRRAAGICRSVDVYTSTRNHFTSSGGSFSITPPALIIPNERLIRVDREKFLEKPEDPTIWEKPRNVADRQAMKKYNDHFNNDETRFFIAREMAHMRANDTLLRIAIKILFVAGLFLIYALPFGALGAVILFAIDVTIYVIFERCVQRQIDNNGVEILITHLERQAIYKRVREIENVLYSPQHLFKLKRKIQKFENILFCRAAHPLSAEEKAQIHTETLKCLSEAEKIILKREEISQQNPGLSDVENSEEELREIKKETTLIRKHIFEHLITQEEKKTFQRNAIKRAATAAYSALKKLMAQNIERREVSWFSWIHITKSGNNLLSTQPFLSGRIERLEENYPFLNPQPEDLGLTRLFAQ